MVSVKTPAVAFIAVLAAAVAASCGGGEATSPAAPGAVSPTYSEASFRQAARITAAAQTEVLGSMHAGMSEGGIKGIVDGVFAALGSGPPAFSDIVAAGSHGLDIHYAGSDGVLTAGELVIIDVGATWDRHCADVTRTYPVSGQLTPRQRELYQLVLDVQTAAAGALTNYDSLASMDAYARQQFRLSPLRARDAAGQERLMMTFFTHALGHYVGREVHGVDTGYSGNDALKPGQVIAIEPGLYIASEGIAIRIEDTYLVGSQRLTCLSCDAPKLVEAIAR
jgi:Xaa-Pro aminopeptidase